MDAEKVELSPVEAMTALNWKKSKVYYWIKLGKFETVDRIDGQKIVLNRADIERLRKSEADSESFEKFDNSENVLNNAENLQNQTVSNAAKNYENEQKSLNSDVLEFFQKSLNTLQQMQEIASNNYNQSLKLLTDGQSGFEKEYFEIKAEKKTVEENFKKSEKEFQEKIKKFEKDVLIKNMIIGILTAVLIFAGLFIFFASKSLTNF